MRRLPVSLCAALLFSMPFAAHAQAYPNKPVRFVSGFPPGGAVDVTARIVGPKLSELWGQQVVVDNRAGAAGTIAADIVAKANPDGYTLLFCTVAHVTTPAVYKKLPYDHIKDFAPVSLIGTAPNVLVVHPSLPVKSVSEFIAYAKANPGKINYGSAGVGSLLHLSMEMFRSRTGTDIVHVPYKGGSVALIDLLGGHVLAMFDLLPGLLPSIKAGKVRALGVSVTRRDPQLPDVPTIAESGVPGFEVMWWAGVCAPAKVPKPIVAKLNADLIKALNMADVQRRLEEQGVYAAPTTPEQFAAFIKSETIKWAKAVKYSGATVE